METKLRAVGGYNDYETLVARLNSLPLVDPPDLDLVGYVTDRALGGLFQELAKEEQKIREDPLARTTQLLQRVFRGAVGAGGALLAAFTPLSCSSLFLQ